MPELPEVECVRRGLEPHLLGAIVADVTVLRREMIVAPGDPAGGFSRQRTSRTPSESPKRRSNPGPVALYAGDLLQGLTIHRLERRGKQLAIIASDGSTPKTPSCGQALVIQLGMTGQVLLVSEAPTVPPLNHVHLRWSLRANQRQSTTDALVFRDPRRFGGVRIFRTVDDLHAHWATTLGPDALSITSDELAQAISGSGRAIKAALLDQTVLAGVGNIYADEALFQACISPRRIARRLKHAEVDSLAAQIRSVLARAIACGGSTLRDYVTPNGQPGSYQLDHAAYGRAGRPCVRCRTPLRSAMIAQRTTTWCPQCQR